MKQLDGTSPQEIPANILQLVWHAQITYLFFPIDCYFVKLHRGPSNIQSMRPVQVFTKLADRRKRRDGIRLIAIPIKK
jgi:hypothetical protein